eukprot:snap_masked-scaffold_3-processed-gene-3.47-mRNA-1 protein AED:1.00 eAED:1.00 QI:0/-1/0/0/-1/1/1/0/98
MKGHGTLKSTTKVWTLFEVVTYHVNTVDKYKEITLEKLKDLTTEDTLFCTEVDEMFTVELKLMGMCWILQEFSERKFVKNDSMSMKRMSKILKVVERD